MIKIKDVAISFAGVSVFEDVNIVFNRGDKVGLIGRNGSGKSTFLKIILNKLEVDDGVVEIAKGYKIGCLEQHIYFKHDSVIEEVCSVLTAEREYEAWKAEQLLMGLGFSEDDMLSDPKGFSGGYQVKINLAKLLLDEPNMLLLDEPTNYLDIHSVRWLKRFLCKWDGELILITHDRDFMDNVINHTLNIHRGRFSKAYGDTKKIHEKIVAAEEMYEKNRLSEIKKREETEKWINRFKSKASMAKRVQSKIKALEKQEEQSKLAEIQVLDFKFNYLDNINKTNLVKVNNLSFGYNEKNLIEHLSFNVSIGDKIGVVGKNGQGKSTLLKLIAAQLKPKKGDVVINPKTEMGYFGQMNIERLDPALSIIEEMEKSAVSLDQKAIRQVCGNMLFSGDLAKKKIKVLSGGEKSRVMLGKIILQQCNLLLLDEPTNHLDMDSCESLLAATEVFPGAVLIVTHSEYFLKKLANKLIVFDDNKVQFFDGDYELFLAKLGWSNESK